MAYPNTVKLIIGSDLEECSVSIVPIDGADEWAVKAADGRVFFFKSIEIDDKGKQRKCTLASRVKKFNAENA